jgi:hypothetical protein
MDYFDTFSPIAKLSSFRIILTITTCNDWDADNFDFNGTYLNGKLDDNKEIYRGSKSNAYSNHSMALSRLGENGTTHCPAPLWT